LQEIVQFFRKVLPAERDPARYPGEEVARVPGLLPEGDQPGGGFSEVLAGLGEEI
jgi:hypothetical protein